MKKPVIRLIIISLLAVLLIGCAGIQPARHSKHIRREMLTTGYCSCQKCSKWHRNILMQPVYSSGPNKGKRKKVGVTASGTKARRGTIAADTSRYPFGTVMEIPGYGRGRVEDRGSAIKGDHIDLFFESHKEALRWGKRKKKVDIWIPR